MKNILRILMITVILPGAVVFIAGAKTDNFTGLLSLVSHAEKLWQSSGHADSKAEAFTHWDEEGSIPTSCAKCHSTPGFQDFLDNGEVNSPAPLGTTIECEACHINKETGAVREHTAVTFPSGAVVENLGPEALCMECHQGRASKKDVDMTIDSAGVIDPDTPSSLLRFVNIHYYAAASTQLGTLVEGGYEYQGKSYDARFSHLTGYNACITCHNPHSLEVELGPCHTCHEGVKDPKDIRYYGSFVDYDGDGNITEGMFYEIEDIKNILYQVMQSYAREVINIPIVYDSHTYPYFFTDVNGNGEPDPEELNYGNRYTSFSARLLRAAYNYQVAQKDPAAYAHGGKYIIQILYDSIEDLNRQLASPLSLNVARVDEGHFDGSSEAWRHWDEDGEVPSSCSKCHSAEGLAYFLENGDLASQEISNGMLCATCHTTPPHVRRVGQVTFPSGEVEDMGDTSNLCLQCHQGRASKYSVESTIASSPGPYGFINIHYFPAAAVLFGSEVKGGFEYAGKIYAGQQTFPNHLGKFDTCVECHMGTKSEAKPYDHQGRLHNVQTPNPEDCVYCHGQDISQPYPGADPAKFSFEGIRPASIPDFDGDGNRSESIKDEIKGLEKELYAWIQKYALEKLGAPIVYDSHNYPYFFNDLNANGKVDPGENIYPNQFRQFNTRLLKAAYNFQLSKKEPCGYIHNAWYVAQLLVDSIIDLGGDSAKYSWR